MNKFLALVFTTLLSTALSAQFFEGKIVYENTYKSKLPNVTDAQFTSMMGSTQEYYAKGGDYKSVMNGSMVNWQLYINKNSRLYTKMSNSETLFWTDVTANPDEVLKTEVNKGVTEILGYKCDEVILTCKSGVQKYYFNSKFAVDPKLFVTHKFGNWADFIAKSNALPLKSIIENAQFLMESVAIEAKDSKLEAAFFELPAGVKTTKSPN